MTLAGLVAAGCTSGSLEETPDEATVDAGVVVPAPPHPAMNDEHQMISGDFGPMAPSLARVSDTLQQYAARCDAVIGVTVPDFNCDDGTTVPTTHFADNKCDQPNRLNKVCDPGSRFRVLTDTPEAYVVAHCRKQGHVAGHYGDIAVIQYSKQNGATCFYQALGDLDGDVKAPSRGSIVWPWYEPQGTAGINCVRCHDNGPLIRSPYLTQLTGVDKLPGAGDYSFNRDQPYWFVGADFAAWRAYKVEVSGNTCNSCHRMGTNNILNASDGTALDLGIRATGLEQSKNGPSVESPMWMLPGQTAVLPIPAAAAQEIRACALRRTESPLPSTSSCRFTPLAPPQTFVNSQTFGGNIFAQQFVYTTPDTCAPGYVRSGVPATQWTSQAGGFCMFDGWAAPENLSDCRAIIRAGTGGGGFGGTCATTVAQVVMPVAGNLAAFKPTTQSSTLAGADARRAVDTKSDGNWYNNSVTHTDFQAKPWWQVDLGEVTSIGQVVLYNRTDCCNDRLADFDVQLSNDGSTWTTAASFAGIAPVRTALAVRGSARFVRVQLRGTNYLSLAEVQVFAPSNLAAMRPATQSSTLGTAGATLATDGNTDGNWNNESVSHTNFEVQPWWQVDLGSIKSLGEVVLYNRTDCCSTRLANFAIEVSIDGANWQTASGFPSTAGVRTAIPLQAVGRFVRVRLQAPNYLSLAEVQVFAP